MKKFLSILKATMSGDMNVFRFDFRRNIKNGTNKNQKIKSLMMPLFLTCLIFGISFQYALMIGKPLKEQGVTYVLLTLYIILAVIVTFLEGVYKSQGILFDAKDNDLLLALPIKKSYVLSSRIIKLISFQYIMNFLFTALAYIVYACYEKVSISYYFLAIVMFLIVPIIPAIIACIFGYIIKACSTVVKHKNTMQVVLSLILTFGIFYASFNVEKIMAELTKNATSINDLLFKIYYPAGLFISIIQEFDMVKFLILLGIHIIPAILFIKIFSIGYFNIISKLSENYTSSNFKLNGKKIKIRSQFKALIIKELKKYFSTPVYVFNTAFGIILILIAAIAISINFDATVNAILGEEDIEISMEQIIQYLPKIFMGMIIFMTSMVSITASSISLEGKSFNLTKTLPIDTKKIFAAKVLMSNIITVPLIVISSIILIIKFKLNLFDSISLLLISNIIPTFFAILGLIINLNHPMLNAKSDVVVVKQSVSTMIAILFGMVLSILIILGTIGISKIVELNLGVGIMIIILIIITYALWKVLNIYGKKKFDSLNT